jgi:predicted transcriptional regulator of viral defense system
MAERLKNIDFSLAFQRTKLAEAAMALLEEEKRAAVTPYALFHLIRRLFTPENRRRLYLRGDAATTETLKTVSGNLLRTRAIETDPDYGRGVYRVPSVGHAPADDVCALANPFGYISHLSAMQRWGLTDRRPEALCLTMPPARTAQPIVEQTMTEDYGAPIASVPANQLVRLHFIRHPEKVRGRKLSVHQTKQPGQWIQVRESWARLGTVGQTFVDMVEWPQYCGGMAHVLDVWREHTPTYRENIITAVEEVATPIGKVRAGYLLDEMLESGDDSRIQDWVKFAQRGSSRVLDPTKGFAPDHSKKWMLSINV